MLGRWDKRIVDQASDVPSIIFFHDFLQNSLQKSFQFIFLFFYKITKIKIKSFECPKSIKSIEKNNTWNIWLLVDDSFVPSSKQPSVIYCRLTDFKSNFIQTGTWYDFLLFYRYVFRLFPFGKNVNSFANKALESWGSLGKTSSKKAFEKTFSLIEIF